MRPRHPRAPFLWIAKERGERKLAPGERPRGFCPRRATPALRTCPPTGVAGVARTGPRPKAPPPACSRQGQKTPRRPPRKNRITPRTGSACLKRSSRIHFTTTRHAASLRPPRNGRIGLNHRIPKGAAAKGRPPPGTRPSHSASVIKTWFSMGGMARAWRQRQWQHRDRNATRKGIPANTDCRGGVFATRRFPRPPPPPCPSHALRFL